MHEELAHDLLRHIEKPTEQSVSKTRDNCRLNLTIFSKVALVILDASCTPVTGQQTHPSNLVPPKSYISVHNAETRNGVALPELLGQGADMTVCRHLGWPRYCLGLF